MVEVQGLAVWAENVSTLLAVFHLGTLVEGRVDGCRVVWRRTTFNKRLQVLNEHIAHRLMESIEFHFLSPSAM